MRVGVDAGGTFTDFVVLHDDGRVESFKLRSNPASPARVIEKGLKRAGAAKGADVIHGSTVATNALLERKGARTAFLTTEGFRDLLHIGRQNRPQLYNLTPPLRSPLVPRALCLGVSERTHFDGVISKRPSAAELRRLGKKLRRAGVQSVAICFLHSYQNPENEQRAAASLGFDAYVCCSHEVVAEFREYERASTTVINGYVGPLIDAYLTELACGSGHNISILQSNGGFMTAAEARRNAVRTILSGPAGGVVGATRVARLAGFERVLTFDMGGTSTDVSLSDGRLGQTIEASIDNFPIRVPVLDIHTVGAGGGSIARVDEGGLLRVGPESAGADPGPACYGVGEQATVTDAHVVLGRIASDQLLGGEMRLDEGRAARVIEVVAQKLRTGHIDAAEGILRVANANMERAIRVVSIERGRDPRDFALVAFGGCGGLHACELANELGIRTVIVPRHAGALSALGMLLADRVRDYSVGALGAADIEARFRRLEQTARRDIPRSKLDRLADLRYAGQSYELTVPWDAEDPARPFHSEHRRLYGFSDVNRATEIVTLRLRATEEVAKPALHYAERGAVAKPGSRLLHVSGRWRRVPVYPREQISRQATRGPALIIDYGATALVPSGWSFRVDRLGNLLAVTS